MACPAGEHPRCDGDRGALPEEGHAADQLRAPDGSRHHNRLWNGGNGWGTVKLYDRQDGQFILVDEIEATHIGCEYGEYDHNEPY